MGFESQSWVAWRTRLAVVGAVALLAFLVTRDAPDAGAPPVTPPVVELPSAPIEDAPIEDAPTTTPEAPDLAATVDAFLAKVPVKPFPRPKEVLEGARQGQDLIDYRMQLEKSLKHEGGPVEGARMLIGMKDDSKELRFQTALGLSKRLDEDATRVLLDGLNTADPTVRPDLVFALRGSPGAEAQQAFVDLYTTDLDPQVRAQAAFVIGERGDRIDSLQLERARQTARGDLGSDDGRLVTAASDVLGTPPLSAQDRSLLEGVLAGNGASSTRLAAFRALASGGVAPQELAPLMTQVAADSSASEELRNAANSVLQALANPPPPEQGGGD